VSDWLSERRGDVAAEKILDAAERLFVHHDAATVGMNEIAKAAGCSRATLYRYFENRDALHTAYVHRETYRVFGELGQRISSIVDRRERLLEGVLIALRSVRESPALSSWFASTQRPIGGEMAERSDVIRALTESFLASLGINDVERRARWLIRVMISLLIFPGRDDAEEREMLEQFVLPLLTVSDPRTTNAPG
jgi:AcrR family transcriptional regulator